MELLDENREAAFYYGKVRASEYWLGSEFSKVFRKIDAVLRSGEVDMLPGERGVSPLFPAGEDRGSAGRACGRNCTEAYNENYGGRHEYGDYKDVRDQVSDNLRCDAVALQARTLRGGNKCGRHGEFTAGNYDTEDGFPGAIRATRALTDRPFHGGAYHPAVGAYHTGTTTRCNLRVCAEEKVAGIEVSGAPIDKAAGPEYIDMLKKRG
jgi:hypothetical protein